MADLSIGKIPKAIGATQIGDSIITDNGVSGVTVAGALLLGGATSGTVALRVPAIAGASSITLPSGTTNFTTTGGAGMVLQQATLGGPITVAVLAPSSLGGLGAGVATWLATPSSANLLAAITDETGSGALVFANSPALAGNPTAPTPALSDSDTSIATTAYVKGQNYLAGNQSITLSGDIAGTGTTAITTTLATVLLTPGTFQGLTVNGKGLVTAAANMNYPSVTGGPLTAGSVLFGGAGGAVAQNNPGFFWDNTNGRLGIGTNAPDTLFDIMTGGLQSIRVSNKYATGAGTHNLAAIEAIGVRGDANGTVQGKLGLAFRRSDGSPIDNAYFGCVGSLLFGGQWGADTTYQDAKVLYPASINGFAEAAFTSATVMPTALAFNTSADAALHIASGNAPYGTERMRITSAGRVGIGHFPAYYGAPPPQALLHIGSNPSGPATVRSYNVFNDAANGEWCYLGDWGGAAGVARYGTGKNGTGTARNIEFLVGGLRKLDYGISGAAINATDAWTMVDGSLQLNTITPLLLYTVPGASVGLSYNSYWNGSQDVFGPGSASKWAGRYDFDYTLGQHRWFISTAAGNAGASNGIMTGMALKRGPGGHALLTLGDWPDWTAAFPALRRNGTALEVRLADDSGYAPLAAGAMTAGGLGLGAALVASVTDLSKHISLYSTGYGFSVTSGRVNYNVAIGGTHALVVNGADVLLAQAGFVQLPNAITIGTTAATARTYNSFTDASNGAWAYLGDWGVTPNVATFGSAKNGTGIDRPMALMAGGAERLRLWNTGEIVFNSNVGGTTALITVGGTYATNPTMMQLGTTHTSASQIEQRTLLIRNAISPAGAALTDLYGVFVDPTIASTSTNISSYWGVASKLTITAGTVGTLAQAFMFRVADPAIGVTPIVSFTGYFVTSLTHGNGLTTGTVTNRGVWVNTITAGSAGGTMNNRAGIFTTPNGGASAGTTSNIGLNLTGNGGTASGSGVVTNYALYSDSTALSVMRSLRIGASTGAANAVGATEPFMYVTASAGTPTGVPRDAAAGSIAIQWDSTAKKLWVYDQPAGNWKGVVLA